MDLLTTPWLLGPVRILPLQSHWRGDESNVHDAGL